MFFVLYPHWELKRGFNITDNNNYETKIFSMWTRLGPDTAHRHDAMFTTRAGLLAVKHA